MGEDCMASAAVDGTTASQPQCSPLARCQLPRLSLCAGTGLNPPTSAPGLGSPRPRLRRDLAHPAHVCSYYYTHDNFLVYGGQGMKNDFGGPCPFGSSALSALVPFRLYCPFGLCRAPPWSAPPSSPGADVDRSRAPRPLLALACATTVHRQGCRRARQPPLQQHRRVRGAGPRGVLAARRARPC
jgi:hypothetical protein